MTTLRKRLSAAVAIAALATVGLPGLVASAAPDPASDPNIDPDAPRSLTITSLARTGTDGDKSAPIKGVEFTVQQVTSYDGDQIDLTRPEGWQTAARVNVGNVADADLVVAAEGTTGADGTAKFEDLDLGLYYVTETGSRPDAAARTLPFLVTLPHSQGNGGWLYDVVVFPKSSVASANKVVDDEAAFALGSTVTWTLTGSVPDTAADEALSRYVITDRLDERLVYLPETLTVTATPAPATALGAEEDYTVTYTDRTLTIEFTETGLRKLASIGAVGSELTVTFDTEVIVIGDGTIENQANFLIGEAEFTPNTVTEWGAVEIYKHVAGDKDAPLAGAEFEVYSSESDAKARTNRVEIQIGGEDVDEFVTGENGLVLLPGFSAGETVYLVEVKAPAGYTASGTIYPVTIVTGSIDNPQQVSVANAQQSGVTLPELGAQGMALAGLIGLGLIGGGVGLGVASKRRKSAN